MRVRVRINGASSGSHFILQDGTSRQAFITFAAQRLGIVPDSFDLSAVKLYIEGDELHQIDELEQGDVVHLALTGSPPKEAKQARTEPDTFSLPPAFGATESQLVVDQMSLL